MKSKLVMILAAICVLTFSAIVTFPQTAAADSPPSVVTKTWTGGAGDWSDPVKWSPNGVPGATDNVSIETGADVAIPSGAQCNWLHSHSPITINGGTLTLNSLTQTSEIQDDLTLSSGTLTGSGSLTISGLFTWSG